MPSSPRRGGAPARAPRTPPHPAPSAEAEQLCRRVVNALVRSSDRLRRDREDLLQEAAIIAWQHRDDPHLGRLVKSRLIDRIRTLYGRTSAPVGSQATRRGTAIVRPLDDHALAVLETRLAVPAPDDEVAAREDAAEVLGVIADLPTPEREVLLAAARGIPLRRLAEGEGVTESAMARRRAAARRRLAARVEARRRGAAPPGREAAIVPAGGPPGRRDDGGR